MSIFKRKYGTKPEYERPASIRPTTVYVVDEDDKALWEIPISCPPTLLVGDSLQLDINVTYRP